MTRELNIRIDCAGGSDLTSMLEATREQLLQRTDRNHTESRFDVADYKVVELHSRIEALQLTKHCGWCTGNTGNNHYKDTYANGKLWVFYKPKKKRPSYQLFVSNRGSVEFRKKGNVPINPWRFAELNPSVKNFMKKVLPSESKLNGMLFLSTPTSAGMELHHQIMRQRIEEVSRTFSRAGIQFSSMSDRLRWRQAPVFSEIEIKARRSTHYKAKPMDRLAQRAEAMTKKKALFEKMYGNASTRSAC